MKTIVLLLVGITAVASLPRQERIIGGSVTSINSYPFAGSLQTTTNNVNWRHQCGCTIINNRSCMSAAHCWPRNAVPSRFRLRIGSTNVSSGGRLHNAAQMIGHPQYNTRNHDNDIGIIRVSTAFPLGSATIRAGNIAGANAVVPDNANVIAIGWGLTARPYKVQNRRNHDKDIGIIQVSAAISLGSASIRAGNIAGANAVVPDNANVIAIGWGLTARPPQGQPSESLRHVQLRSVNQNSCANTYPRGTITANMLCAIFPGGGRGSCFGDSGTGLIFNNVVVGITSFGQECASARWPGVYARVSRYTAWINQNR